MKSLFFLRRFAVLLLIILLNNSLYSQSGWTRQPVNTLKTLWGISFINDNTGWVVGDSNIILKTTNGGTNWTKTTYGNGETFCYVKFVNQSTGWIGGFIVSHLVGFILRTTNGGSSWNRYDVPTTPYSFFSFRGDTVWSSAHSGYVMRSTNDGINWYNQPVHDSLELYTVYFINPLTGWTAGGVYRGDGLIFKTTNAGVTWFQQWRQLYTHFYTIWFVNDMTGYAVALYGYIMKTINGGNSWFVLESGVHYILFAIEFPNLDTGYASGQNANILKTTNAGGTWTKLLLPSGIDSSVTFGRMTFRSASTGWVIGDDGIILKTTNGGVVVGVRPIGNTIPTKFSLSQNYPNPFNPSTNIKFTLPKTTSTKLTIFDINGREVKTILNDILQAGEYKINFNADNMTSGVYFYRLWTEYYSDSKKMILIK